MSTTCLPPVDEEFLDEEFLEADETGTPVEQVEDEWGPDPNAETSPSGLLAAPSDPAQQGTVITRSAVVSPAAPGGILTPASPGMTVPLTQPTAATAPVGPQPTSRLVNLTKLLYRAARDTSRWIRRGGHPPPPRASMAEIQQELRRLGEELSEAQALNSRLQRRIELLLMKTSRG